MGRRLTIEESNRLVEATLFSDGEELSDFLVLTYKGHGTSVMQKASADYWFPIVIEDDRLESLCLRYLMRVGVQTQEEEDFFTEEEAVPDGCG